MINARILGDLEQRLDDVHVFSVYLDGRATDFAERGSWRRVLADEVTRLRDALAGAPHAEREEFERAVGHLDALIAEHEERINGGGWVAFITAGGVHYAEEQPVPLPILADWRRGIRGAPSLHALHESDPVFVAFVDSRKGRLYRYECAELRQLATVHAHASVGAVLHMGDPSYRKTGTHGRTGTDAAALALRAGRERLYRELAAELATHARSGDLIIVGGTDPAPKDFRAAIPKSLAPSARVVDDIPGWATTHDIGLAAARHASEVRRERDRALVNAVFDAAAAGQLGVVGATDTRHALRCGAVHELLLTDKFINVNPDRAERFIHDALADQAIVEVVTGDGAARLDDRSDGVGAILRFDPQGRRSGPVRPRPAA
jgi:Bacterial archaeo-eukaryotic release factor family 10